MAGKVLKRLKQLIKLETKLERLLAANLTFIPPILSAKKIPPPLLEVCRKLKKQANCFPYVILTAYRNILIAVHLM